MPDQPKARAEIKRKPKKLVVLRVLSLSICSVWSQLEMDSHKYNSMCVVPP